jgi:bis(5'-nucleosyl)-tetraphosphatase (symmetrical)
MGVYAIGDIQGCFEDLQRLLEHIRFDPATDRLWFVGDLVNRGPQSLETLRFVRELGERAITVLGNHDLHLIATAHGRPLDRDDHTLDDILQAPDRTELVEWLCRQPLLHHDHTLDFTMVHAGLPPQWDLAQAQTCAHEVEQVLRSARHGEFINQMYGNQPRRWSEKLHGWDRLRFAINCFTRIRYCDADGKLDFKSKGPPGTQPAGQLPWFTVPKRASRKLNIVFGHWSTLGACDAPGIYPTDSGCLWGGALTALRIDGPVQRFTVPCIGQRKPGKD